MTNQTPQAPQPLENTQPMPPVSEQLQDNTTQAIINNDDNATNPSAAGSSAEDTPGSVYEQQIQQLIDANKSLQNQIGLLLRNGASVNDSVAAQTQQQTQPVAYYGQMTQQQMEQQASDDYVSLADLGKEFGKRSYENINMEK